MWKTLGIAAVGLTLTAMAFSSPAGAFHGGWWTGRGTATTSNDFPNPGSIATEVATGKVFDLDLAWGGGGGNVGTMTLKMFDQTTGALVHASVFAAKEDISSVEWVACPFANSSGPWLEIVPNYSVISPGVLSLGPGAPGGTGNMRNSFCNDSTVADNGNAAANDPLYYKAFSDYTGTYVGAPPLKNIEADQVPELPGVVYVLEVYVRGLDHA